MRLLYRYIQGVFQKLQNFIFSQFYADFTAETQSRREISASRRLCGIFSPRWRSGAEGI